MTHQEYLNKIIRIRKKLIKLGIKKKDTMRCLEIITRLERQIEAYSKVWKKEGWKKFLQRNYNDILFLIPGNKGRDLNIEILNSLTL